jgi:hypothetical protein
LSLPQRDNYPSRHRPVAGETLDHAALRARPAAGKYLGCTLPFFLSSSAIDAGRMLRSKLCCKFFQERMLRRTSGPTDGFYDHDIAKITSGNMLPVLRRAEAVGGQLRKARGVIV